MEEKTVLLEKRASVAIITLNRPKAMNSFNEMLVEELTQILGDVENDETIRVAVLTGAGRAFSAGGDLVYLSNLTSAIAARDFITNVGGIVKIIMEMKKPIIGMVNGVAAGAGFNLALACDIIYCAKTARFGQSFVKVGLVPDCGGQYLLPRVVGLHRAKELMFTGDLINAQQAYDYGIVNQVCDDVELRPRTLCLADRIAAMAPLPLGMMKKVLNRSDNLSLEEVLEYEADLQTICMQTADHKEGVAAFREKREPVFIGE